MILVSYYGYIFRFFFRPSACIHTQVNGRVKQESSMYNVIPYVLQGVHDSNEGLKIFLNVKMACSISKNNIWIFVVRLEGIMMHC